MGTEHISRSLFLILSIAGGVIGIPAMIAILIFGDKSDRVAGAVLFALILAVLVMAKVN
jgi:hypothetical protein